MTKSLKHKIILAFAGSMVAGPAILGFAAPVQAGAADCLAGIIAGKASATAGAATGLVAVPTMDAANLNANSTTAGQTTGLTVQRCIVQPLVTVMARALLDNFTNQTVRWINSGFQGSPLYVTNLQGFLAGAADQAAGQFIQGLGPIGQILCSPFDMQVRLSLGILYSPQGTYQYVGCRLSDVQKNIQRAFTGGTFGKNGWDSWIQVTAIPQNNPYGAYLQAVDAMNSQINGTQVSLKAQLDFGKGFLSSVDPETGEITTPGSLIEDQLSNTLGQSVRNVGLATDIDAILNALVGQMVNQVMGGIGGLLGAGGGGGNYTASSVQNYTAKLIESNKQAQNLPDGFFVETGFTDASHTTAVRLGPTGTPAAPPLAFCGQFRKNVYGTNTGGARATDASAVWVKVNNNTSPASYSAAIKTSKKNGAAETPWTVSDYNNIQNFCQNVTLTSVLHDDAGAFNTQVSNSGAPLSSILSGASLSPDNNMALNKPAEQSSIDNSHHYDAGAQNAVDGNTTGSGDPVSGLSLTKGDADSATGAWWQVDLGDVKPIGTIQIYRSLEGTFLDFPFYVFVTKNKPITGTSLENLLSDGSGNIAYRTPDGSGVNPTEAFGTLGSNVTTIPINASGRFVRIAARTSHKEYYYYYNNNNYYSSEIRLSQNTIGMCPQGDVYPSNGMNGCRTVTVTDHQMGLAEVKVFPPGVTGSLTSALAISFTPEEENAGVLNPGSGSFTIKKIRLVSNLKKEHLKARVKLMDNTPGTTPKTAPLALNSALRTLSISAETVDGTVNANEILDGSQCLSSAYCLININAAASDISNNIVTFNKDLTLEANQPVLITFNAQSSFVTVVGSSYKLVTEILDSSGTLLASHTTSFIIR